MIKAHINMLKKLKIDGNQGESEKGTVEVRFSIQNFNNKMSEGNYKAAITIIIHHIKFIRYVVCSLL